MKNVFVTTEEKTTSVPAKNLFTTVTSVKMETLKNYVHLVWIEFFKDLIGDAKNISEIQDIKKQRNFFKSLSKNTYKLIKVSKFTDPIYYQNCPKLHSHWLSKEDIIKNPYCGSQMLSCGTALETIK